MKRSGPWKVCIGAVLGLMVGNGPIMQFTFGVFILPVTEAFGTDRRTTSLALLLGLAFTGLMVPVMGLLVDRFGIRRVSVPAITLFAIMMAAVGLFATSITAFIVLYALAGIAASGQTPLPYAKAVTAAFDDKRGLALGIAMAGVGVGAALMPQLAQALVTHIGWRNAYIVLGAVVFVVAVPSMLFLIRDPVAQLAAPGTAVPVLEGPTAGVALKTSTFWMLGAAFFIVSLATAGVIAHVVPLLGDRGIPTQTAISAISASGVALIVGRLLAGYLLDRFFGPYVAVVFFLLPLAGIAVLLSTASVPLAMAATVMVGLGLGAEIDLIGFLLSRYFGRRAFGLLYGYLFACFMLASGLGPYVMALSYEKAGNYTPALILFGVLLALSAVLVMRLGPYAYGVQHIRSNERKLAA